MIEEKPRDQMKSFQSIILQCNKANKSWEQKKKNITLKYIYINFLCI